MNLNKLILYYGSLKSCNSTHQSITIWLSPKTRIVNLMGVSLMGSYFGKRQVKARLYMRTYTHKYKHICITRTSYIYKLYKPGIVHTLEIPCFYYPKVHYHTHKTLTVDPTLTQLTQFIYTAVTLSNLVWRYQRLGGISCLHLKDPYHSWDYVYILRLH
jgi:hypothetical protein